MAVQDTNINIKFCIATADNISNQPVQNGVVYYDPSGSVAALDWRNSRYYASKFIPVATAATYTSMTKVANSVYYIIDSNVLYFWNGLTSARINIDTGLPDVTATDNGKILKVVNGAWALITPSIVYTGTSTPEQSLGNNGDVYLQTNIRVIYETDGSTGLLGHNQSSFENQWQLQNLDLTPYKYIKCYFKATTSTDSTKYTPAVIVTVQLDDAARGATTYFGGTMVPLPFNRNRYYLVSCAVDGTKTKFQVVHQNTIWDVTTSDANTDGRYLYKIEGYIS